MTVKGRIAQALLTMEEKFGCDDDGFINLSISRQDLASFAGTTYETVFRVLSEFVEEKLIKIESKKIKIVDKSGLSISLK
jgi:CRP-like cAMP-binding protein